MTSIIAQAKQTVDEAVDVYFGRALAVATLLVAGAFAVAGAFIWLISTIGAVGACFAIAALFVVAALVIRQIVAVHERRAAEQLAEVEEQISDVPANAAEFLLSDPSRLLTYAPMVMPVLQFARRYLPLLMIVFFVALAIFQKRSQADTPQAEAEGVSS